MGYLKLQSRGVWELARRQHWVVTWAQLLEAGFAGQAIKELVARGALHRVHRGVYVVGRPELSREGRWMAAVLRAGPGAVLSHRSAALLWGISDGEDRPIEVSISGHLCRQAPRLRIHRRTGLPPDHLTRQRRIPVTSPAATIVDLAVRLSRGRLERLINQADVLDLINPEALRAALTAFTGRPGVRVLREALDRRTFVLTSTELERLFVPIARRASLPKPEARVWVNGFEVDFYWPRLGLVVETDGLRYHRTPAQQARDRLRDQTHTAAGLTCLRFTHAQVKYEPDYVRATLAAVARRLHPRD